MDSKNEISVELGSLSDLVSGISRRTPYEAPDGYFDQLAAHVLARLASKSSTFHVPGGYFEGFAGQVLARIKTGSGNEVLTPPGVPGLVMGEEGVEEELARISAVVSRIGREMPYRLPEGYFEEISPVLTLLRGKPTYQAPAGYFDQLESALSAKAVTPAKMEVPADEGAKVVPFGRQEKVLKGNWWKYSSVGAVAASLILIFSWPQLHTDAKYTSELRQLALDLPQSLHRVSDQEIQNYLDDQNSILTEPVTSSTASLDMDEGDVKSLLGEVPDGELQQYMEEHGRATDIATN